MIPQRTDDLVAGVGNGEGACEGGFWRHSKLAQGSSTLERGKVGSKEARTSC